MSGWIVLAGTTKSRHHQDNQDSWATDEQTERLVLVVSDGAGSAARSDEGSQRAATAAVASATDHDGAAAVIRAVESAREELAGDSELAATIVVAVIGDGTVDVCAIGDSPAFVEVEGVWHLLQAERKSEFVNETEFLTSVGSVATSWHIIGATGVVLASDGIAHSAIGPSGPEIAFFGPVAARARAGDLDVQALLEWMNDGGRLDDDTTLVVALQGD